MSSSSNQATSSSDASARPPIKCGKCNATNQKSVNKTRSHSPSRTRTFHERLNEREANPHRLKQRQKQIEYGKNTLGYYAYINNVPRHDRRPDQPCTPNIYKRCSKRAWDAWVRSWRRQLHQYDPQPSVSSYPDILDAGDFDDIEIGKYLTEISQLDQLDPLDANKLVPTTPTNQDGPI